MENNKADMIEKESIEYARNNARDTYSFYNNELDLEKAYHAGRTVGSDELEYWKKRCEAAERVMEFLTFEDGDYDKFQIIEKEHEQLKLLNK